MPDAWRLHRCHGRRCYFHSRSRSHCRCRCFRRNRCYFRIHNRNRCYCRSRIHIHNYNDSIHIYKI